MKSMPRLVAGVVMVLAAAAPADEPLVLPDTSAAPAEDVKAVREMLGEYVKAVAAGDRDKAVSFCVYEDKETEKVQRLSCEIDFAIAKLRAAVEAKLGKDAWGTLGEVIGEMTPEDMKEASVTTTDKPDEYKVNWAVKSKIPEEKRLSGPVTVVRDKKKWKFRLVGPDEKVELLALRRMIRDELGELADLTADVTAGKVKTTKGVEETLLKIVREVKGDGDGDGEPKAKPAHGAPEPMPDGPIDQ
jgi:hypothetical protein